MDKELTEKTRALLRERTATYSVEPPGAIHELGSEELAALKQSDASDTAKVLNLRKVLAATVNKEAGAKPFLLSIGERAEALAQAYEDRQLTTRQVLTEFERLAQEYVQAEAERTRLGVDDNTFAVYTALRALVVSVTAEDAQTVNEVFGRFPDFRWNARQQGRLRAELYKTLRPVVGPAMIIEAANALLQLHRV
ncbi:MAG: type I restriction enzyme endonuclease domain-containing protein [Chloroflexota bacterium]